MALYSNMKVIKRIRRQSPEQKFQKFYQQMGIITKALLVLYTVTAFVLSLTYSGSKYAFLGLFFMRITEIVFFVVIGVSDLKRQEEKGSFYLLITFFFKNILLWGIHKTTSAFVLQWPDFGTLSYTAISIQYLLMIAVEDAFAEPQTKKYLILYTFQLKARFYPLFLFLILMITSIRVDLILPFFLGIAIHFGKVNLGAEWLSKRLNDKLVSDRLISFGFIRDEKNQRRSRPIDELATNDSIYLEEK